MSIKIACVSLLSLLLGAGAVSAQQYPGGSQKISSAQGTLVVNSGYVNNLNAHTFHVYSFMLMPKDTRAGWQQVPVVESDVDPDMRFSVTTANTADFALRDAKVAAIAGKLVLRVAQLKYKDTPYDNKTSVEVRRYELKQTQDEERWVFAYVSSCNAGSKLTVEQALDTTCIPAKRKK